MEKEKHRCAGTIRNKGGWGMHQCSYKGSFQQDGKWYCKTHYPVAVAKKDAERHEKWRTELAERRAISAYKVARESAYDAIADIILGSRGYEDVLKPITNIIVRTESLKPKEKPSA